MSPAASTASGPGLPPNRPENSRSWASAARPRLRCAVHHCCRSGRPPMRASRATSALRASSAAFAAARRRSSSARCLASRCSSLALALASSSSRRSSAALARATLRSSAAFSRAILRSSAAFWRAILLLFSVRFPGGDLGVAFRLGLGGELLLLLRLCLGGGFLLLLFLGRLLGGELLFFLRLGRFGLLGLRLGSELLLLFERGGVFLGGGDRHDVRGLLGGWQAGLGDRRRSGDRRQMHGETGRQGQRYEKAKLHCDDPEGVD